MHWNREKKGWFNRDPFHVESFLLNDCPRTLLTLADFHKKFLGQQNKEPIKVEREQYGDFMIWWKLQLNAQLDRKNTLSLKICIKVSIKVQRNSSWWSFPKNFCLVKLTPGLCWHSWVGAIRIWQLKKLMHLLNFDTYKNLSWHQLKLSPYHKFAVLLLFDFYWFFMAHFWKQ